MNMMELDLETLATQTIVDLYLELDERKNIIYEVKGAEATMVYVYQMEQLGRELRFRTPQYTLSQILTARS